VPKTLLTESITKLGADRMERVWQALVGATGC